VAWRLGITGEKIYRRKKKMSYGKNRETRGLFLIIW
jgi:hypothetical protein